MKIIQNLQQRTPEWHAFRKEGIGSSDIAAIVGCHLYKSAHQVYQDKVQSQDVAQYTNKAMERGIQYEDKALKSLSAILDMPFEPITVQDDVKSYFRASLDGYNAKDNIVVEIKIPSEKNYDKQIKQVPDMYYCQVQWQMLITGSQQAYLYVYKPEKDKGHIHWIKPDLEYQTMLSTVATDFWENYVMQKKPPEEFVMIHDEVAIDAATELRLILDLKKKYETRAEELKNVLKSFVVDKPIKCQNFVVKRCKGKTSLDKDLMIDDGIDLRKYEKVAQDYWRVEQK